MRRRRRTCSGRRIPTFRRSLTATPAPKQPTANLADRVRACSRAAPAPPRLPGTVLYFWEEHLEIHRKSPHGFSDSTDSKLMAEPKFLLHRPEIWRGELRSPTSQRSPWLFRSSLLLRPWWSRRPRSSLLRRRCAFAGCPYATHASHSLCWSWHALFLTLRGTREKRHGDQCLFCIRAEMSRSTP